MQDGYRIFGSGKSGKMAKIHQHHKFPPCLGNPSMGERTRRILHTFSDITNYAKSCETFVWILFSFRRLLTGKNSSNCKGHRSELSFVFVLCLNSRPLKTIFQHKVCIDKLYTDSFYKVQKNSHCSFEVICCC